MTGRIVWLASYPKSGNTWFRAIVTALSTHPLLFGVNRLANAGQPHDVHAALSRLGLDHRWLDRGELDRVRSTLVAGVGCVPAGTGTDGDRAEVPVLCKTHESYRSGPPGAEPFPAAATRAAILVVRDPRDVVGSFAAFFDADIDGAIDRMAQPAGDLVASPGRGITRQPWGTWSSHTESWLDPSVPFPVHLVRYEDLHTDAVATLGPVMESVGLPCGEDELAAAVDRVSFDRLRDAEDADGFRETSRTADRFFRRGVSGGWRSDLSDDQVAAVEADHGEVMVRLGYEPVTGEAARSAVAEARASVRRRRRIRERIAIAPEVGLDVSFGAVPESFGPDSGAVVVSDHVVTTPTATIVRVGGSARVLIENGRTVTVDWPADHPDGAGGDGAGDDGAGDDISWVVQGWAVAVASLQRGDVSLHASTVRIGGRTVAIAGHRRAGKSTTCMGLRRRGHELLVDDTTVVEFRDGEPYVIPYARNVHLLPDSAAALGVDFDRLDRLAGGRAKAAFLPEGPDPTPRRLDRIVVLQRAADIDVPDLVELGPERVAAVSAHARRGGLAEAIVGADRFFAQVVNVASSVRVQVLRRPAARWSLDEVLDLLEGDR